MRRMKRRYEVKFRMRIKPELPIIMGNVIPRKLEWADSVVSMAGHSGNLLSW